VNPSSFLDIDFSSLPRPEDDGAAAHLMGAAVPTVALAATDGTRIDLASQRGRLVVYAYPLTGKPGRPLPDGWDVIPGARGCTPESCGFRDHFTKIKDTGVALVFGLSTQDTAYQVEVVQRLELPFPLLSDASLQLAGALRLPTMEIDGQRLLKRHTLVIDSGYITKVFYPVFPPDRHAEEVLAWLEANRP
jgi:peroxiredoxin